MAVYSFITKLNKSSAMLRLFMVMIAFGFILSSYSAYFHHHNNEYDHSQNCCHEIFERNSHRCSPHNKLISEYSDKETEKCPICNILKSFERFYFLSDSLVRSENHLCINEIITQTHIIFSYYIHASSRAPPSF
jgi:hypothetical protein